MRQAAQEDESVAIDNALAHVGEQVIAFPEREIVPPQVCDTSTTRQRLFSGHFELIGLAAREIDEPRRFRSQVATAPRRRAGHRPVHAGFPIAHFLS